jgi:Tfp pilus assembly protein PilF
MSLRLCFLLLLIVCIPGRAQEVVKSAPVVTPELEAKAEMLVGVLRQANDLLSKGDLPGAISKVNIVLKADPRNLAAYLLRGAIYSKEKQWPQAQSDYEAAHLIDPHSAVVQFNLAEIYFAQKQFDAARPGFASLEADPSSDLGDLSAYKVFLCDLFGGHDDAAAKDLAVFNQVGTNPSYYFANATWDLYHHKTEDGRGWLLSANNIYPPQKNGFYAASLFENGYLPLPPESGLTAPPTGLSK